MTTTTARKPGDFRGVCRLGEWLPVDRLTPEEAAGAADLQSKWDRRRECETYGDGWIHASCASGQDDE